MESLAKATIWLLQTFIKVSLSIANSLYIALAFSSLWGWFITEQFDIRQISVLQAWGILMVISFTRLGQVALSFLMYVEIKGEDKEEELSIMTKMNLIKFVTASVLWGYCWVLHSFM